MTEVAGEVRTPPPDRAVQMLVPLKRWPTPSCLLLRGAVGRALLILVWIFFILMSIEIMLQGGKIRSGTNADQGRNGCI